MQSYSKAETLPSGGDMIVLIFASLLSGIITIVCAWQWLGIYSILIAPLGAGIGTVLMGFTLACIRKIHDRRMRITPSRAEPRQGASDEIEQIKHN
jgi:hypothetical protein